MSVKEQILNDEIPNHIAVIMDGNGRWAKKKGNSRIFGHKNAINAVREVVEGSGEIQVKYLTLYTFSTENWNRPKEEVAALMSLLVQAIHNEVDNLHKNNVRLKVIGDMKSLPSDVINNLKHAITKTENNSGLTLILALSYSSHWEINKAIKNIVDDIVNKKIAPESINETLFRSYLETKDIPDPELLIRTSGELRISNFLLYQLAYTELYFTDKLWPDFKKEDLFRAILDYQKRERRFGKTSEQLT
ncbi:MAG: isoprenyl transferase [Salinivirgaceae bacterium]|jgi:undecaprenyl diphosphate synthase|nr:isoprenyl transferase [Bacteroidales bacterium]